MSQKSETEISAAKPSREQIAIRAELLWKARGCPSGQDEEIWLHAERQLYDEAREIIGGSPSESMSSEAISPPAETPSITIERTSARPQTTSGRRKGRQ